MQHRGAARVLWVWSGAFNGLMAPVFGQSVAHVKQTDLKKLAARSSLRFPVQFHALG
jgi:hypothetical protein